MKGSHQNHRDKTGINYFIIAAAIVFADQLVKFIFQRISIDFHSKLLNIHIVKNTGAAFSILADHNNFLICIGLIVLGLIFFKIDFFLKEKAWFAYAIITGGIIGNLLDRIFLGHVVDFLDIKMWPVFNLADSAITIGIILLLITEFIKKK